MVQAAALCPHLEATDPPTPAAQACQECGSRAPIRLCLSCGHVGCCDSTRGHATAHSRDTGHPGIRPLPLGPRTWTWCYSCRDYVA